MKCRALSENKNIVWFGKTKEEPTVIYYEITVNGVFYKGYTGLPNADGMITINGVTYRYVDDKPGSVNGTVRTASGPDEDLGIGSRTTPPVDNYVEDTDAVAASLNQRLSVIKGELWYQVNYGLPLTEKQQSTTVLDLVIGDIISSHPGVASLDSYKSKLVGHTYYYDCQITSVLGETLSVTNNLTV